MIRFAKYEALANDYLVVEAAEVDGVDLADLARRVCRRHRGVGADGILVAGEGADPERFTLRIMNPDGSEAEKSGNGLRIHARYLFDRGRVRGEPFQVETHGGTVSCTVLEGGARVVVEMGRTAVGEIETLDVAGESVRFRTADLGNPHCVVLGAEVSEAAALRLGPALEAHPRFPARTNVQLVERRGPHEIGIEIWERGTGRTLASGSSSCAAAAVAVREGLCESPVDVVMPGGRLQIELSAEFHARMTGPVRAVADGTLAPDLLATNGRG